MPYLVLKAAASAFLSALHFFAAFCSALLEVSSFSFASSSSPFAFDVDETHFPNALALFPFVPYLALNASSPSFVRSAAHAFARG